MTTKCPICGKEALEIRKGKYSFDPPPNIPGGAMVIDNAQWEECAACGERIASIELDQSLEDLRYRRLGLLTPKEIRSIRERAGLSQEEIADKIGVGEKTYTRWELGYSLQNTSNDNLIRLFARDAGIFDVIEAQRHIKFEQIEEYMNKLPQMKGKNELAIAAHGDELNTEQKAAIHKKLKEVVKNRGKGKAA